MVISHCHDKHGLAHKTRHQRKKKKGKKKFYTFDSSCFLGLLIKHHKVHTQMHKQTREKALMTYKDEAERVIQKFRPKQAERLKVQGPSPPWPGYMKEGVGE